MDTINLKTTQSVHVDLSITIPSFHRNKEGSEWLALLSKENVISMSTVGNNVWISKQSIETAEYKVVEAVSNYYSCTESEFLEKYDELTESISKTTMLEI